LTFRLGKRDQQEVLRFTLPYSIAFLSDFMSGTLC